MIDIIIIIALVLCYVALTIFAIYDCREEYELFEVDKIRIPKYFTKPNKDKLARKEEYFLLSKGDFDADIVLDDNDFLVDGYCSYLLAQKYNIKVIKIKRK